MPGTPRTLLMLFFGDTATDRRTQNFRKFFEQSGWNVELLAVTTTAARGPRKFLEYHQNLAEAVRTKYADVVFACDLYSLSAAAWLKRHKRVQFLIYDAREVYTELPTVAKKPIAKFIWRTLERQGLAITDIIVTTGPHDIQAICDVHKFLPRPVLVRNLPWYNPNLISDRSLLDRFGIPREASVFVYIGGLQEGRGLKKLVQAVENGERRENNQPHILLIGDGILKAELEDLAQKLGVAKRIHFAGVIPSEEAIGLAAACDVGVSLIEPISRSYELALPSKLFEYMMAGIPVVSSKLQQVIELFENERWITFVDVADPVSIKEGMNKALVNSTSELREVERDLAHNEFHFERDAALLLEAMDGISKALPYST